jgi:phenylalanyl-tRNA synthetase beta chain
VFLRDATALEGELEVAGLRQPLRVAGAAFGPAHQEQWGEPRRAADFYDVKGDVEALFAPRSPAFRRIDHPALHPGRSAEVMLDGRAVGWLGELHPRLQHKYELPGPAMLFELEAEALLAAPLPVFREVSRLPAVQRDLAVLVDASLPASDMVAALRSELPAIVESVEVFDVYRGKGMEKSQRSLAFRILMQDTRRTLTDVEADEVMALATSLLERRFGAQLRK